MIKEKKVTGTEYEYYCDLCGEEVKGYSSYGSITYPSDLLEKCGICRLETCPSCRTSLPHRYYYDCSTRDICKICATYNADKIIGLYEHLKKSMEIADGMHKTFLNPFKEATNDRDK